jgi:pimeloyl-ACP methyl ester carboxylesterase
MPKIFVNGTNLYYEFSGPENGPVLVLSNGIMMSTASWAFQKIALEKHLRILLYDCRGMWKSDHPDEPYSMRQHADDLAELLKALHIEKAHIAGISYGAEISMVFAIQYPEMTKSLVVIDGVSEIHHLLRALTHPWLIAAEREDPDLLFYTSFPTNFSERWIEDNKALLDASKERYASLDFKALANLMKAFYDLDITDRLQEIKAPTLVIAGQEDLIKGQKYAKIIAEQVPNSELVIVPFSGHALCLEKPNELNTLLLGFVVKYNWD